MLAAWHLVRANKYVSGAQSGTRDGSEAKQFPAEL